MNFFVASAIVVVPPLVVTIRTLSYFDQILVTKTIFEKFTSSVRIPPFVFPRFKSGKGKALYGDTKTLHKFSCIIRKVIRRIEKIRSIKLKNNPSEDIPDTVFSILECFKLRWLEINFEVHFGALEHILVYCIISYDS